MALCEPHSAHRLGRGLLGAPPADTIEENIQHFKVDTGGQKYSYVGKYSAKTLNDCQYQENMFRFGNNTAANINSICLYSIFCEPSDVCGAENSVNVANWF